MESSYEQKKVTLWQVTANKETAWTTPFHPNSRASSMLNIFLVFSFPFFLQNKN